MATLMVLALFAVCISLVAYVISVVRVCKATTQKKQIRIQEAAAAAAAVVAVGFAILGVLNFIRGDSAIFWLDAVSSAVWCFVTYLYMRIASRATQAIKP